MEKKDSWVYTSQDLTKKSAKFWEVTQPHNCEI